MDWILVYVHFEFHHDFPFLAASVHFWLLHGRTCLSPVQRWKASLWKGLYGGLWMINMWENRFKTFKLLKPGTYVKKKKYHLYIYIYIHVYHCGNTVRHVFGGYFWWNIAKNGISMDIWVWWSQLSTIPKLPITWVIFQPSPAIPPDSYVGNHRAAGRPNSLHIANPNLDKGSACGQWHSSRSQTLGYPTW